MQSEVVRHQIVEQTAGIVTGGTAVYTIPTDVAPYTDQMARIKANVFLTAAAAAHLANGASLVCECVVINKNGTVTFNPALATSTNPVNSNTAGFELTSRPETADAALDLSMAIWTIVANVLTLTITNAAAAGGVIADITAIIEIDRVGST